MDSTSYSEAIKNLHPTTIIAFMTATVMGSSEAQPRYGSPTHGKLTPLKIHQLCMQLLPNHNDKVK